jgi:flagellar basal-body rod protein FlgG
VINGLLAAASGMEAQQAQLDAISNDLANVSTTGYQSERLGFRDLLYGTAGPAATGSSVVTGDGAVAQLAGRDRTNGSLQQTGRSLDVAIQGPGYIEVRRPDGTIGLTRDGALEVNGARQLTNAEGLPLVPAITLPSGVSADSLHIAANGTVTAGGRMLGRISLVDVPAPDGLIPAGDSQYTASAASGAIRPATGATVTQGALEASNVDVSSEMATMIQTQRAYEMDSKAIQMQDQMLQIANGVKK